MIRPIRLFAIAIVIFLLATGSSIKSVNAEPEAQAVGYSVAGNFSLVDSPQSNAATSSSSVNRWSSLDSDSGNTGSLTLSEFPAPRILSLEVTGHPSQPNIALVLSRTETGESFRLAAANSGAAWQRHSWRLPNSWVGNAVRLKAIDMADTAGTWIGISELLPMDWSTIYASGISAIALWVRYSFHFLWFVLPGIVIFNRFFRRKLNHLEFSSLLIIGIIALLGYIVFWFFWFNHIFGIVASSLLLMAVVVESCRAVRNSSSIKFLRSPDIAFPLLLMYLVGLFYLSILYLYSHHSPAFSEFTVNFRFMPGLPPDNILPNTFTDRLYFGNDPRPLMGEWQSSDRPPLQSGIFLIQRALTGLLFPKSSGFSYQIVATISQCSWVIAVWVLCRQLKLNFSQIAVVFGFCIGSGFFLLNSLFVWPKLLAAALGSSLVILVLKTLQDKSKLPNWLAAAMGVGTGLGLMAHTGVVFTLIPTLLILIMIFKTVGKRQIGVILCTLALIIIPWIGYQKLYEPPGNRLVKWHLAGVIEIDDRSTSEALMESYRDLGLQGTYTYKVANLKRLFHFDGLGYPNRLSSFHQAQRRREFFVVFLALGVLNIGWLLMLVTWLRCKILGRKIARDSHALLSFLPLLGTLSLAVWCLLMFGPAVTSVHAGSYGTMLILFVGLGAWLAKAPFWLKAITLIAHIALFASVWLLPTPPGSLGSLDRNILDIGNPAVLYPSPNWFVGILVLLSASLISLTLIRMTNSSPPSQVVGNL